MTLVCYNSIGAYKNIQSKIQYRNICIYFDVHFMVYTKTKSRGSQEEKLWTMTDASN